MADRLVDGIDNGLPVSADLVDTFVEIENPPERLLRRGYVVSLAAKYDDRRANITQVDRRAIRYTDISGGQVVANEQLINDELDLSGVQIDMAAPPALKAEIPRCFRIDFGIQIVLLGPERVCGILILEILHQPSAVKFAVAQIAHQRGQPAAAKEPAGVAHWILTVHALPIFEW